MAFKSVFDPAFKYRTAIRTDIRETFKRVKREQQLAKKTAWNGQERRLKLVPIDHADRRRKLSMPADVQLFRVK
jgi:hypothetical protein